MWSTSQAQTVKLARVGPQRMPVYEHLERSFGFGSLDSPAYRHAKLSPRPQMLRRLPSQRSISHALSRHGDLARAIILRGFEDSQSDPVARRWFEQTPQPMLEFWCQLAQQDPERVRKRAREMMKLAVRASEREGDIASQPALRHPA